MATKTEPGVERSIEHELEEDTSHETSLSTLTDRENHRLQMQEIKRRTVEPGIMRLNVKRIVSAENSPKWAIDLEHPVHDEDDLIRIFLDKPTEGWSRNYQLVRVLDWYGITNQDPHQLEFEDMYVAHDEDESNYAHGWHLIEPPDYEAPMRVQLARKKRWLDLNYRPRRSNARMWLLLLGSVAVGPTASSTISGLIGFDVPVAVVSVALFVVATVFGMAIMERETDE